jgi:type 1 glutamine amidotransferase
MGMRFRISVVICAFFVSCVAMAVDSTLKVAVVSGGHPFDEKSFYAMFEGVPGVDCAKIPLKDDSEIFEDISNWSYDVVVLYNFTQKISDKRKANLLTLTERGVGFVVLHHAIANYADWPEYRKIVGARYYLEDVEENGVKHPRCEYEHGVDFKIHVEDAAHPIVKGIADFTINDETYKGYSLEPDNHLLLTSNNPKSQKEVGWTRVYKKSKVCYLQMGHGESIFADENFRRLVTQSIQWTAAK